MPRLFVAIDFPASVRRDLAGLCHGVPGARWVDDSQLHLTLRFIGEVDHGLFADIADGLADVAAAPIETRLKGVGHFPPRGQPRVLWAGVADAAPVVHLHNRVEAALRTLGVEPDARKFAPHVTLARLKGARAGKVSEFLATNCDFVSDGFTVDAFHLYSSRLGSQGAIHLVEASYALDGVAG